MATGFDTIESGLFANYGKTTPDLTVTATASLTVNQRVVECQVAATSTTVTITLPSVHQAAGKMFTITATTLGSGSKVTVADAGDSLNNISEDLDEALDALCMFSNGRDWFIMATNLSA